MQAEQTVHVIDDGEAMRHSLEFLLDYAGLKARTHASATQFLEVITTTERGCIVSDVRMPDMSGLELVNRLKELGIDDPVIITGHADVPLAIEAMKAGVVDFLEKPVGDQAMLKAVRAALDQRSSQLRASRSTRSRGCGSCRREPVLPRRFSASTAIKANVVRGVSSSSV